MKESDWELLYKQGCIGPWYLRPHQQELYKLLKTEKRVVTNCHRRYGKGTSIFVHGHEECLKREEINVRYGAETQTKAHRIFRFLTKKIFDRAPRLEPKWSSTGSCYEFPSTGSKIFVFGCSNSEEADKARGEDANIIIADEYAFWKFRAKYMLQSILSPQLSETQGQMIIATTPPEDLTHHYITEVAMAQKGKYYFFWNVWDTVKIGQKERFELEKDMSDSGLDIDTLPESVDEMEVWAKEHGNESWKREWECDLIATKERLVIPEAQNTELYLSSDIKLPSHYETYVMIDLGFRDFTAALFAVYDFRESRIIIVGEVCKNYATTSELVDAFKCKEQELGWDRVYRRQGDCSDLQQLFDMHRDHEYQISPITKRSKQSNKGFKDSVINELRLGIQAGKIVFCPDECPMLAMQLRYGIWNERRTDFERTETMGHLDALMALAYLYDNIHWERNPYPAAHAHLTEEHAHFTEYAERDRQNRLALSALLGRK